jgi:RNA polymerase sigma-B factor
MSVSQETIKDAAVSSGEEFCGLRGAEPRVRALFVRLWREDDLRAREALVEHFLPLARSLARRYNRSMESQEDLVQVASLGLVKAVDRFDPTRSATFTSFAVPTILGELKRHFRDHSWAVHVPRGAQELSWRIEEARKLVGGSLRRAPTVSELAEYLEITDEEVLAGMQSANAYRALSLDAPCPSANESVKRTFAETLGVEEERYELVENALAVSDAIRSLDERERLILSLRFHEQLTQTEIAGRVGVSQMQVSRLLRGILERLREIADGDPSLKSNDIERDRSGG